MLSALDAGEVSCDEARNGCERERGCRPSQARSLSGELPSPAFSCITGVSVPDVCERASDAAGLSNRPQLPSGPTSVRMPGPFDSLAFTSLPLSTGTSVCQVAAPKYEDCVWVFCMGLRFF